jgi:hypothetical protein
VLARRSRHSFRMHKPTLGIETLPQQTGVYVPRRLGSLNESVTGIPLLTRPRPVSSGRYAQACGRHARVDRLADQVMADRALLGVWTLGARACLHRFDMGHTWRFAKACLG